MMIIVGVIPCHFVLVLVPTESAPTLNLSRARVSILPRLLIDMMDELEVRMSPGRVQYTLVWLLIN